ncbi:MAG: GatB/YqeY domain-containing protein [Pseudomonadota bacterium]
MRDTLSTALKNATREQDKRRIATLRLINAAIKDRDIAARTTSDEGVSDTEILEIMAKMIKQRRESVSTYEQAGRLELAQQEQEEITIIEEFMPKQMAGDEMESAVDEVLRELECSGLKDMGRAMSTLKDRYAGQMDFSAASKVVKARLAA